VDEYRVDIRELRDEHGATTVVDGEVALSSMEFGQSSFAPAGPAHAVVTITNSGAGFVAYGTVDIDMATECARCLAPFTLHVTGEVEGFYVDPGHADGLPEDQEWAPIVGDEIDLLPALDSAVRIELPLAPLHAEDCAGICPTCGLDRNTGTCTCDSDAATPGPFDALRSLLPPEQD
jgi:uncharacterized protein